MVVFEKLVDRRAFAGGLALMLVGLHLTIMMAFYFVPGGETLSLLQSRWWWEISFNLQILCMVLMWMSHSERVRDNSGWRRARAVWRMFVGLAGVSTPAWVLVFCAYNNWFHEPPDLMELAAYSAIVFLLWAISAYILPLLVALVTQRHSFIRLGLPGKPLRGTFILLFPFLLLGLISLIDQLYGSHFHIVVLPVLTYTHGAIPYLRKAYAPFTK